MAAMGTRSTFAVMAVMLLGGCTAGVLDDGAPRDQVVEGAADCFGGGCATICGTGVEAVLTPTSAGAMSGAGALGFQEGEWVVPLEGFQGTSPFPQESLLCDGSEAWSARGVDASHPRVTFEGGLPYGWHASVYDPAQWSGEPVSTIPGWVRIAEASGMPSEVAGGSSARALEASAWSAEVALSRIFSFDSGSDFGQGARMRLSALIRFVPGSYSEGWVAIGLRPLAAPDAAGAIDPDHPEVWWVQTSPRLIQSGLEHGDLVPVDEEGGWYRLDLGAVFEPPAHESFAVHVRFGTAPESGGAVTVLVDELALELVE